MNIRIPDGTPFQQKVWRAVMKIPRGKTTTYKELARRVGKPRAVRAVANAVGANKLLVTIPCHRVVRSDGTLGGYAGGLAAKKKLLALEQAQLPRSELSV
jgi:O-6-methylguanine DNA methyltransferase